MKNLVALLAAEFSRIVRRDLAAEFSRIVRRDLAAELPQIVARNKRYDRTYSKNPPCATADFSDSNMLMLEAFALVTKSENLPESDEEIELWNEAWNLARRKEFQP